MSKLNIRTKFEFVDLDRAEGLRQLLVRDAITSYRSTIPSGSDTMT